jgi:type IV pilus assembly protein PilN
VEDGWGRGGLAFLNMRVDINLATQPYEDVRRFWLRWGGALAGMGILTLLLLYLAIAGLLTARQDRNLIRQRQQQIAERDREKAQAEALLNRPENRSTRDRSQFLNDLFQRKAFSWTRVFEDLERIMPARLHVVSIRPELAPDNQLAIDLTVAGNSREPALALVEKMEASQRFQQTRIEQEESLTGQADTVQFNISAVYVPEAVSSSNAKPGGTP